MGRLELEHALSLPPVALKEPTSRRARCPIAIGVIDAPVARTHKEVRLREPAHWAPKVCAVNGKDLKILSVDISNPARNIRSFSIPGI